MLKKVIFALLIGFTGFLGWLFWGIYETSQESEQFIQSAHQAASPDRWKSNDPKVLMIGNPEAKVTMIEYADFKCPECGKYYQNAGKKIRTNYVDTGLVKIVFRPYPVYADDGVKLLIGSYCIQEQGKFASFHDAVFDYMWVNHFRQEDYQKALDQVLTDDVVGTMFTDLGIDPVAYKTCFDSNKYFQAYEDDVFRAAPDEIQGTPSFMIGGRKVVGPQPYSVFKALLDIELDKVE